MKTSLLLVVLILVGLETFAQVPTDNPVLPRIYENGYSIEQIKEFALGNRQGVSSEYARSYRIKLLSVINEGLKRSGEYVKLNDGKPLGDEHVEWIYQHVYRVQNDSLPIGHRNTWHNGSQVSWTDPNKPQKKYYGPLDRFAYGVCIIKLDKPGCANLNPDFSLLCYVKQTEPEQRKEEVEKKPENKDDNLYQLYKKAEISVDTTQKVNPSVVALGKKQKKDRSDKTWVGRNLLWLIPAAAVLVTGSVVLIVKALDKGAGVPPHGTMSGGRAFDTTGTTTGLPSTDNGGSTGGRGD